MNTHADTPMIALSISDPPKGELERRGLSKEHLEIVYLDLTRHLFSYGYHLGYGGYLSEGYSTMLLDLIGTYQRTGGAIELTQDRCRIFLADYLYDTIPNNLLAAAKNVAQISRHPDDPTRESSHVDPDITKALQLTSMRNGMTVTCSARVSIGGNTTGTAGRVPGVVEECYLAAKAGQPLYLAAGFAGATEVIADLIRGIDSPTVQAVLDDPLYSGRTTEWADRFDPPGFAEIADFLSSAGLAILDNGLSITENDVLMTTDDIDEIVTLVMTGITRRLPI